MDSYTIVLKNDKLRSYHRMADLILLLHLFYFIYGLFKTGTDAIHILVIAVILVSLLLRTIGNSKKNISVILFLFLALCWFILQNYWLGTALFILALLDLVAERQIQVTINKEKLELSSFPKKMIRWDELNNVVLKDRMLTIDYKNDRIIQAEISPESYNIDEGVFNGFCSEQMGV